ncbi:MAG: P-loop NTPase [Candidatus Woesearchaeota archaeon]|jgi:septum site-determining protein MinD|nr:P-loop NTPase [Candidatus Woesearchaeota archaeon]
MTKFIAVAGKGGVGKTVTAINLASAMHDNGKNVILLDANVGSPHVALHLGFPDVRVSLHEVLEGKGGVSEAVYVHPSGLKVIPSNVSRSQIYSKQKDISSVALELIGKAQVVVMDLPGAITDDVLPALGSADETIVVANPEISSISDAFKIMDTAEGLGSFALGVVLNRARRNEKIEELGKRQIGTIPEDANIAKAISLGHPVVHSFPLSPASFEFKKLSERLG